jgi:poly-gamma-glutamate capsule biosynthesis protein CapA/YwtB (metallophosphatase superfamily)
LPIVTVQGFEVCQFAPHSTQRDFAQSMAEAGAMIVSGSQAHCPQAYAFQGETFIHYGLGNLWFDQMDWITRQEILDRHVFYNGRHISTEIKTALLEDSARPRPMSIEERRVLLEMVFDATN